MREFKENRVTFVVDDSTGVIEASVWKRNGSEFPKAEKIKNSLYVRILGNFDYFFERKCFEIERIDIVENFDRIILFEKLLFESHNKIFSVNLKENIESKINPKLLEKSSNEYYIKRKEYANRFLNFFLWYNVESEEVDYENYVTISVENLLLYENFFLMTKEFMELNNVENIDEFIKDVFCFLQEKNFIQVKTEKNEIYEYLKDAVLVVKTHNPELEKSILGLFQTHDKDKIVTLTYNEIFDFQNKKFFNYYTNGYINNFLRHLCEKKLLIEICHNTYAFYEFFV
jgi:hypothetical protein